MKPSEAILKGVSIVPHQARFNFFEWAGKRLCGACALGTALVGAGAAIAPCEVLPTQNLLDDTFGKQLSLFVSHPVTRDHYRAETVIQELNDRYSWSRERIAGWLDEIGL